MNRDASLFRRAPGSGLVARHVAADPPGRSGSAVRRIEVTAAGPDRRSLRHSKSGRGRSSYRSPPDATARTEEQPRRRRLGMRWLNTKWTNATIAGILALHACPARCGARRRAEPPSSDSAPCLPLKRGKSYPPAPSRPARAASWRPRGQRHPSSRRRTTMHPSAAYVGQSRRAV